MGKEKGLGRGEERTWENNVVKSKKGLRSHRRDCEEVKWIWSREGRASGG